MDIIEQLKRDEGWRDSPYNDTRGISTVGYGHNLVANPLPGELYPMSPDRGEQILRDDVFRTWGKLQANLPWIKSLSDVYSGVLENMAFNMGVGGLLEFHHMLSAVQSGNYQEAASQMQQSAWFGQVGARARRLQTQMLTGVWQ